VTFGFSNSVVFTSAFVPAGYLPVAVWYCSAAVEIVVVVETDSDVALLTRPAPFVRIMRASRQ